MTLEEHRRSKQAREVASKLLAVEQEMWEGGQDAILRHQSPDNILYGSHPQDHRLGLAALARLDEAEPFSAVKITEVDSTVAGDTAVLHYLVVLKVAGFRTPKIGACLTVYCADDSKPSGWAVVAHQYKTLSPKRFRELAKALDQ